MPKMEHLSGIGKGIVVIIVLFLIMSVIFSTILRFSSIAEQSLQWILTGIACIIFFIGGWIASRKTKEKGFITGVITALGAILLFIVYQFLGYDASVGSTQALLFLGFILSASIGGVIGVNVGE